MAANGIDCDSNKMVSGQCKLETYKLLKIKGEQEASSDAFIQDAISGAVFFIGTLVAIALVVSGLMFVFAGADPSMASKAKQGVKNSIIGLLLVVFSYAIIRVVQYMSSGN